MDYQVIDERWKKIQELPLKHGSHSPDSQFCVMEAVAFVAGEPWSDHPLCACPIITSFLIRWNDRLPNDAERDRLLKPLVPRLVGSRKPSVEVKRVIMIGDWTVRTVVPELLRVFKNKKAADELANLPEITTSKQLVDGLARALALARDLDLALARDLARALARARDLALALDLDLALARDLDLALALARDLDL